MDTSSTNPPGNPSENHQPDSMAPGADPPERTVGILPLSFLSLLVGLVAGGGAVAFRGLIGLIHNLMFLGKFSFFYDARLFTPDSPWAALVIAVPVIGAIGVTLLVVNFAPEAKGHGVPEVMDAIYYDHGIIRPVVAVIKSVASALAIGSGAAVGREGPIIQIGATMGSTLGQILHMRPSQQITLVAAGAGAGIAATFNTPIGGVLFATELMLPEVSVNTFLPVAVATGVATSIGRMVFGASPSFEVPARLMAIPVAGSSSIITLALYAVMGVLVGIAAAAFVYGLQWAEDMYEFIPGNYLRHGTGMLLIGVLMYAFWLSTGHYYVEGIGYAMIQATLKGQISGIGFLLLLFAGKLFATTTSLGSGSSGGIFSPSLFMGAAIGAAFASGLLQAFPGAPVSVPAFAMVGMAAMVGGATGAAMTAVTMIFEMTGDFTIVLPMILAVATAYAVRRYLSTESIYTMKIARRGHPVPKELHANLFLVKSASELMERDVAVLDASTAIGDVVTGTPTSDDRRRIVVTRGDVVAGWLDVDIRLLRAIDGRESKARLGELARRDFVMVHDTDPSFSVITLMKQNDVSGAIVIGDPHGPDAGHILGIISDRNIADAMGKHTELYPASLMGRRRGL